MKQIKKDELYEIFQNNLNLVDPDKHEAEHLINKTVEEYIEHLFNGGYIPVHFVETVQEDLSVEVREMFQKKTYGFHDLKTYVKAQKSRPRARSNS